MIRMTLIVAIVAGLGCAGSLGAKEIISGPDLDFRTVYLGLLPVALAKGAR